MYAMKKWNSALTPYIFLNRIEVKKIISSFKAAKNINILFCLEYTYIQGNFEYTCPIICPLLSDTSLLFVTRKMQARNSLDI